MLTIKAMTGGESYAAHHLSNNDYYAEGESITGQWVGRGAQLLGLEGAVTMEQFDAIRQGIDPATGEFLRQRQSADRYGEVERNGITNIEKVATARNLYDFVISAPKGVSVQALEDPRLILAHREAATEAFQALEGLAGSRIRKAGANENRFTSNMIVARYEHDTSRELDMQLHTHFVAGNLTYDGMEAKWKALQASDIYEQVNFVTEAYRNSLARKVTTLGYEVENRFEHGKDLGFTLAGLKEETLEKFSQRSAQRDTAISNFIDLNGRLPTKNEVSYLVRATREGKLTEISTAEVKARQFARLTTEEASTLTGLHRSAIKRGSVYEYAPAGPSFAHSREHLFERVSVAKHHELKTEALRHGRGRVELPEVKAALLADIASGAMLSARGEAATQESLSRERWMVAAIDEGIGKFQPLGRRDFVASDRSRSEQKTAVREVLNSRDLAVNLRGAAGTGKTVTLQELHRGLNESRRSVVAVAPTTSAVEEMQKVGFRDAMTVARLLADPKQQHELAGQVLLVDEAAMVSSKDMARLIDLAKTNGARIVYSGDTLQIKSVSEGDALRVLERESNLKSVSLLQVQRQTNAAYKSAVESLRTHPAEGFSKLEAMGAIHEVDWRLRGPEVSKAYREASMVPNAKGQARSVLVIAATHDEIKGITDAIRKDRKRAGELGEAKTLPQHTALNWTKAQRKHTQNYRTGQVLTFHKAVKDVAKNEALEVVSANKGGITAQKANGQVIKITGTQAEAFGVFEKRDIEVSAGDKLLLQANWKDKSFKATNGELVTVAGVEGARIRLEDGREMPAEYRQFTHGYAVTAHRSQGKTVDYEIIAAERMAQDLFYVSATRAREGLTVITSDSLGLQESIGVSGDRQSAIELAKRAAVPAPAKSFTTDDLFQIYQAHEQARQAQQKVQQQEITQHHVSNPNGSVGISL